MVEGEKDFGKIVANSVIMMAGTISISVASIDDLIQLKTKAGRSRDLADIEVLKKSKEWHHE